MAVALAAAAISAIGGILASSAKSAPTGPTTVIPSVRVEAPVFGTRIDTGETIPLNAADTVREISAGNIGYANAQNSDNGIDFMPFLIIAGFGVLAYMVVK